jgi:hypothetical protein
MSRISDVLTRIRVELSSKGSVNVYSWRFFMPDSVALRLAELPKLDKMALAKLWKNFSMLCRRLNSAEI